MIFYLKIVPSNVFIRTLRSYCRHVINCANTNLCTTEYLYIYSPVLIPTYYVM